jgi:hypothetical protein
MASGTNGTSTLGVEFRSRAARAAFGAFLRAAQEIRDNGTFRFNDEAASSKEINALLK